MKKRINNEISVQQTPDERIRDRSRDKSYDYISGSGFKNITIAPKFEVQPARINHFTGEAIYNPPREYTPKRSHTLLQGTFATSQKKRKKDQMFIDDYTKTLNALMTRKRLNSRSPHSPSKSPEPEMQKNVQEFWRRQTL